MNRRSARSAAGVLVAIVLAVVLAAVPAARAHAQTDPVGDVPVVTANPFLPEERDLTDCIGMLQRPGCGSESRGGLHQNLVALAMVAGLVLVLGRVAWGVRRSQQRMGETSDDSPTTS